MSDIARLAADVDEFANIIDQLAAVAARTDADRRLELTRLRRQLSDQIANMRESGAKAFSDPELASEYRARLSTVLSVVAMHQANFPAVKIDEGSAAYRDSANAAAVGNRAFIDWVRAALARQG